MEIKGKVLPIPIIQGGMGIGISLKNLAGNVAKCGGMGIISSANTGFLEKDFDTNPLGANLRALRNNIIEAKEISKGNGLVGVNIMCALTHYEQMCKCAVEAGADVIISGAGLPLNLPKYTKGTATLAAPIVSSGKGAGLICKSYIKKYGVLPDFIVIEGSKAGGHLGFTAEELEDNTAKSNDEILKDVLEEISIYDEEIPVFVAGGVYDGYDIAHFINNGASGVQIATRFIATNECDANIGFKRVLINAKKEDIIIVKSPVGMPARAVRTPLLDHLLGGGKFKAVICNNCLTPCKKGDLTPYCISRGLVEAALGNYDEGLFFCGENAYRLKEIVSVKELMDQLVKEWREA